MVAEPSRKRKYASVQSCMKSAVDSTYDSTYALFCGLPNGASAILSFPPSPDRSFVAGVASTEASQRGAAFNVKRRAGEVPDLATGGTGPWSDGARAARKSQRAEETPCEHLKLNPTRIIVLVEVARILFLRQTCLVYLAHSSSRFQWRPTRVGSRACRIGQRGLREREQRGRAAPLERPQARHSRGPEGPEWYRATFNDVRNGISKSETGFDLQGNIVLENYSVNICSLTSFQTVKVFDLVSFCATMRRTLGARPSRTARAPRRCAPSSGPSERRGWS